MSTVVSDPARRSGVVDAPDSAEWDGFALEQGWGDGLPLVPPTPARVNSILEANPWLAPDEVVATVPPRETVATGRLIAVNAVMAGCLPEYLPVIVTALRCVTDRRWNLPAIQATTHPAAPVILVHGPVASALGVNCGSGAFGPGSRANATIGRAVYLALRNLGGARPGEGDQATQGQPGKYTFCVGENSAETPWHPLHERRGLDNETSAVTVFPAAGPTNVNDHVSGDPVGILSTMADVIAVTGSNNAYYKSDEVLCVLGPEHAAIVANANWSVSDVTHYLYERARIPMRRLRQGGSWGIHEWPPWMAALDTGDDSLIPMVADPSDFVVVVAGGPGKHSSVFSSYNTSRSVTLPLPETR